MLTYVAAAFLYTKRDNAANEELNKSKGVLLKKGMTLYSIILAAYLGLIFVFMITFQSGSQWGSVILISVLGLNLIVPVINFSLLAGGDVKLGSVLDLPSETDLFLFNNKGKDRSYSAVKNKQEFWLVFLTFMIIIGISRMMDENAVLISLHNSDKEGNSRRTFQIVEMIGAFTTAMFLQFFRIHISPYALLLAFSFFLICSQLLMFFISVSSIILYIAVLMVSFLSGGTFTLMGVIAHEDYGVQHCSKILGLYMTGAAIGIFIFDILVFDQMYEMFASETDFKYQNTYGKWNKYIFLVSLLSSGAAFIMSLGAFLQTRKGDGNKDKVSNFINI